MSSNRNDLLAKIATLYYEANLTQSEIAKRLNKSRPTISSMLQEARDKGIVRINIIHKQSNVIKKEEFLAEKFNLQTVIISTHTGPITERKKNIGLLCAEFVEGILPNYHSLGLGWGTTVYEFVQAASFYTMNNLEIIPLMGGIGIDNILYHSNHLAFQLAEKYKCNASFFYAPAIAENEEVFNIFQTSNLISRAYNSAKSAELAIFSIGNPTTSQTYQSFNNISPSEHEEIKNKGAIGDILGTFFDSNGDTINTSVSNRMTGLKLKDIEMMNEVLIFGVGEEKAESFSVLLNKGFIDHLIIDQTIADYLIQN